MKVYNISIKEIIPYENNPRNNENAVESVAKSIQEYGFKVPLVIDKNKVIINGHTRLLAAKKLGLKEVPCIIADDLDEDKAKALRLVDNKTHEYAQWDIDKLMVELDALDGAFTGMNFEENTELGNSLVEKLDRINNEIKEREEHYDEEEKVYSVKFVYDDIETATKVFNELKSKLKNCEIRRLW